LEAGLHSKGAFTLRCSQVLLASSRGDEAPQIASNLGCGQQTVRDAVHDFNARGLLDALVAKSLRPRRTREAFDDEQSAESLRELLHRSAREFGHDDGSLWTLEMAAQVAFEEGISRKGGSRGRPFERRFHAFSE
jgi:transposase